MHCAARLGCDSCDAGLAWDWQVMRIHAPCPTLVQAKVFTDVDGVPTPHGLVPVNS